MIKIRHTAILLLFITTAAIGTAMYPASEKTELKLNLKEGDKFYSEMMGAQEIGQTIGGTQVDISTEIGFGWDLNILEANRKGYKMEGVYRKILFNMYSTTFALKYDSDDPEGSNEHMRILDTLIGGKLIMQVTPDGNVTKIEGAEELLERMENAMESSPGSRAAAGQLKEAFSEKKLKESFEQGWGYFPGKKVRVGQSWKKKAKATITSVISTATTYTLKDLQAGEAIIDVKGDVSLGQKNEQIEMSLSGKQKGTLTIDRNTGMVKNGEIKQDLNGTANSASIGEPWPVKMTGTYTYTTIRR